MTATIVYLNRWNNGTFYQVSDDELRRRYDLQKQLEIFQAEIDYLCRDLNEFQKFVTKEKCHHEMRELWRLIKNE